jgi:methylated-DNA-[protein]-cysteine S-methyltransferase
MERSMSNQNQYTIMKTPVGSLLIAENSSGVSAIIFNADSYSIPESWHRVKNLSSEVMKQLQQYFNGERYEFDLPLAPEGTPFQLDVWRALEKIPYGETISYLDLAKKIGKPAAVRAVGAANGANPLPIVIPCHRVIGHNGKLTGYGGGLEKKQYLLSMESLYLGLRAPVVK